MIIESRDKINKKHNNNKMISKPCKTLILDYKNRDN
jgi:hypothetical protein